MRRREVEIKGAVVVELDWNLLVALPDDLSSLPSPSLQSPLGLVTHGLVSNDLFFPARTMRVIWVPNLPGTRARDRMGDMLVNTFPTTMQFVPFKSLCISSGLDS
jgi:hypothetical protein